jgi:hypothetical protein
MSIKKFLKIVPFLIFTAFIVPVKSSAAINIKPLSDSTENAILLRDIVNRVTEIQSMDKTNLDASEKRELKKELTGLKQKADGLDKRVYLSVGAIIIIILLLILIL